MEEKCMKKLAIIPAYNEMGNIEKTVNDIREHATDFDYIVIDDCSTDDTGKICEKLGVPVISLPTNLGIGGGVQTGYLYAVKHGYDIAVQFDGDGQHNASYLDEMAEYLKKNDLDMLIGSRYIEHQGFQSSFARRMGIRYFTFLIWILTGKRITDPTSGMRMVNKRTMELLARKYPRAFPEPESLTMILKRGYRVEEIPVIMNERETGKSSISKGKSIQYMFQVTAAVILAAFHR